MPGSPEGGALEKEIGEVVLGLIGAGRGHGDLDPAHALAHCAPIFKSLSRMVPQVAVATWVRLSPIRRSASSRTHAKDANHSRS
jgi:hypothetical protein